MTKLALMIAGVMLAACTSEVDAPPQPSSCDKTLRNGTYMLTYAEQSGGTCGVIPSGLSKLDNNGPPPEGCTVKSETWTEGDCKLARDLTCVGSYSSPTEWGGRGGFQNHGVAVTTQKTADGSRIEGVITMEISTSGGGNCRSTYSISAVRQ